MRKVILFIFFLLVATSIKAQDVQETQTVKVWRVNFLNPAIEIELPTSVKTTFSAGLGIGFSGSYPSLTNSSGTGFIYILAPFLDLQEKWFYKFKNKSKKGTLMGNNAGDFVSIRLLTRGKSIASNVNRTSNYDFAIGPTWGIQRQFGNKFHLLFDMGPQYYFDTKGNGGFWPLMLQLNLGYDLY